MRKFIAYDKDTFRILGYIENEYTKIEDTEEIFQNFENHEVIEADDIQIPFNYGMYKLIIEDGKVIRLEEIQEEV